MNNTVEIEHPSDKKKGSSSKGEEIVVINPLTLWDHYGNLGQEFILQSFDHRGRVSHLLHNGFNLHSNRCSRHLWLGSGLIGALHVSQRFNNNRLS